MELNRKNDERLWTLNCQIYISLLNVSKEWPKHKECIEFETNFI